ncbi:methionine adenosyltransferase, partial [Halomonas sp. ZH2S]|nr:methionine adenosyltransferase [Halomonas zhuhanensis]
LTSAYGHFGREPFESSYAWIDDQGKQQVETFTAFPWEKTDKADALRQAAGI